MRRSTVELAQIAFAHRRLDVLPGAPLRWTLLGLGGDRRAPLVALLLAMLRPPMDKSWRAYYAAVGHDAVTSVQQAGLAIAFLPHQAWVSADAILRTLWRLCVTRTAAARVADRVPDRATDLGRPRRRVAHNVARGGIAPRAAGGGDAGRGGRRWRARDSSPLMRRGRPAADPVVGVPAPSRTPSAARRCAASAGCPRPADAAMRYALLHWHYFDRFVTAETNWLAPDNFQEDPAPVVAMRTSPTNIGTSTPRHGQRARSRLHHRGGHGPAAGACLPLARGDATVPRPLGTTGTTCGTSR